MLAQLCLHLTQHQQRGFVWVQGEQTWARELIQQWLNEFEQPINTTWFGDLPSPSDDVKTANQVTDIRIKQYKKRLGQETDILVYDAYAGLNPDALGALVGTVKLGGVCIVISPKAASWINYIDPEYHRLCVEPFQVEQISHHYITYITQQLLKSKKLLSIEQNQHNTKAQQLASVRAWYRQCLLNNNQKGHCNSAEFETIKLNDIGAKPHNSLCKTEDQYQALTSLCEYFANFEPQFHQQSLAAVIESDRGRGKSALLGLLSGAALKQALLEQTQFNIVITAANVDSTSGAFEFCGRYLTANQIEFTLITNTLVTSHGQLHFVAPDTLELHHNADLILVDEAATIPVSLLTPLIEQKSNVVFATTIHGYEGTGRGFEYKFKPLLKNTYNQVLALSLSQPIRWNNNDVLEDEINNLLMINANLVPVEPANKVALSQALAKCKNGQLLANEFDYLNTSKSEIPCPRSENVSLVKLDPAELINQPKRLAALFALLVNAHYRTTPNDLRNLLDGANISLYVLEFQQQIVAAAVVAKEGNIPDHLAEQIWQGTRRPKGHLLPQSLIAHSGFKQAGTYTYGRVIRIAVHPELQNMGMGGLLLQGLKQTLANDGLDFLSTSFGIAKPLLRFWQNNGFTAVRLGLKAEASTGEHSVLMTFALNSDSKKYQRLLQRRFQHTLALEHKLNMRRHDQVMEQLIDKSHPDDKTITLTEHDKLDVYSFAYHHRTLDTCLLAMYRTIQTNQTRVFPEIIMDKIINGMSNKQLIEKYHLTGEKQLVQTLREHWKGLIHQ